MFNLLHIDCQRLFKNRNFYIMLGVTAALLLLLIALMGFVIDTIESGAAGEINQNADGMVQMEITDGDEEMADEIRNMSQLEFASECLSSGFLLVIAGIGAALFASSDFQSGFIRNICFACPRRWGYVLSKILLTGIYTAILTAMSILIAAVCPYLFGLHPEASSFGSIVQYGFFLWLPTWAFGLMALTFSLLTRSSTLAVTCSVLSGVGVTGALLQLLCKRLNWPELNRYTLSSVATACVPNMAFEQMGFILICTLAWAAVYAAASLLLMQKRDI